MPSGPFVRQILQVFLASSWKENTSRVVVSLEDSLTLFGNASLPVMSPATVADQLPVYYFVPLAGHYNSVMG